MNALEKVSAFKTRNIRIYIVGSGEDDSLLDTRIKELPYFLRNSIIKYPLLSQNKLADIYNILDVFIFPTVSASESLGLVAIEAMACGVPVIASDYAAPKYYVANGQNGYKFEVGNEDALANAIERYIDEFPESKIRLGDGALKIADGFKKNNIINDLKRIIKA